MAGSYDQGSSNPSFAESNFGAVSTMLQISRRNERTTILIYSPTRLDEMTVKEELKLKKTLAALER